MGAELCVSHLRTKVEAARRCRRAEAPRGRGAKGVRACAAHTGGITVTGVSVAKWGATRMVESVQHTATGSPKKATGRQATIPRHSRKLHLTASLAHSPPSATAGARFSSSPSSTSK